MSSRNLLITGGSSDTGRALIEALSGDYEKIYAHYRTENEGLSILKEKLGEKLVLLKADLSKEEDLENLLDALRADDVRIDHFIHLPSPKLEIKQFRKTGWEDFEEGLTVSLRSAVKLCGVLLPKMAKEGGGKVLFMLSSVTEGLPPKYESAYVTVKYALLGLMKSLSSEYAEKGITINGISPDMMDTAFVSGIPELIREKNAQESPLKRNLLPQDVLPAVRFLLSDGADAVTGTNFPVTGGLR